MVLKGISTKVVEKLLPMIVEEKLENLRPEVASTVAFYPFIRFQDPVLAPVAEKGYEWIMSSDDYLATEKITTIFTQAHGQLGNNPQAKMLILQALQDGVNLKIQALRKEPSSKSLNAQVELLNEAIKVYR